MSPASRRHVGERAVAEILEESVLGRSHEVAWAAVVFAAHRVEALQPHLRRPHEIAAHPEIEIAVAVGVEERGAGAPAVRTDPRLRGHVPKAPLTVVGQQHIRTVVRHVEIDVAVAIVISARHAHAVAAIVSAAAGRRILEESVTAIDEESIRRPRLGRTDQVAILHAVEVEITVTIEIDERRAAAHDLGHEVAVRRTRVVHEVDPPRCRLILQPRRRGATTIGARRATLTVRRRSTAERRGRHQHHQPRSSWHVPRPSPPCSSAPHAHGDPPRPRAASIRAAAAGRSGSFGSRSFACSNAAAAPSASPASARAIASHT